MSMVVLGAVFVDIKGYPNEKFLPGGRNAGRVEYIHGGVARNIAEDIGNLSLRPVFLSAVDETGTGADVINRLDRHGVETRYIRHVPDGMGTWLAIFDENNDVIASISKRPDLSPILAILKEHGDEIFSRAESILLEFDMERETVQEVLRLADKYRIPVYAAVSNMSIAVERREYLQRVSCFVCNQQEAGILFAGSDEEWTLEKLKVSLPDRIRQAGIPSMVVTCGAEGAVYASLTGEYGHCAAIPVTVTDTTGAGDAFFAGVSAGLTYRKSLREACEIGARMASSVIRTLDNTCPRFRPEEFGIPPLC